MNALENRFYPPMVCLVVAAIMLVLNIAMTGIAFPSDLRIVFGSILFVLGVVIAVTAVQSFRNAKTTLHPIKIAKASSLVTSGIFGLTRNPMYLGMALALAALATVLGGYWAWLGPIAFVAFITRFQILPEERAMVKLFGQEFESYRQRVRRWI